MATHFPGSLNSSYPPPSRLSNNRKRVAQEADVNDLEDTFTYLGKPPVTISGIQEEGQPVQMILLASLEARVKRLFHSNEEEEEQKVASPARMPLLDSLAGAVNRLLQSDAEHSKLTSAAAAPSRYASPVSPTDEDENSFHWNDDSEDENSIDLNLLNEANNLDEPYEPNEENPDHFFGDLFNEAP